MALEKATQVIDIDTSDDDDDDEIHLIATATHARNTASRGQSTRNGSTTARSRPFKSVPEQPQRRLGSMSGHLKDAVPNVLKNPRLANLAAPRPVRTNTGPSKSRDGEAAPLSRSQFPIHNPGEVIDISDDESEEASANAGRKLQASTTSTTSTGSAQLLPSSSNGIVLLKRPREQTQASSRSKGSMKKLKLMNSESHRGLSLSAAGSRPIKAVEGARTSLHESSTDGTKSSGAQVMTKPALTAIDLTCDSPVEKDQNPLIQVRRSSPSKTTMQNIGSNDERASSGGTSSGSGIDSRAVSTTRLNRRKFSSCSTAQFDWRARAIELIEAFDSSVVTERGDEIPESLPGSPLEGEDNSATAAWQARPMGTKTNIGANLAKSKSSPGRLRKSPSRTGTVSLSGARLASSDIEVPESLSNQQHDGNSQCTPAKNATQQTQESSQANGYPVIESVQRTPPTLRISGSQQHQGADKTRAQSFPISPSETSAEEGMHPLRESPTLQAPIALANKPEHHTSRCADKFKSSTRSSSTDNVGTRTLDILPHLRKKHEQISKSRAHVVHNNTDQHESICPRPELEEASGETTAPVGPRRSRRGVDENIPLDSTLSSRLASLEQAVSIARSEHDIMFPVTSGKTCSGHGGSRLGDILISNDGQGAARAALTPDSTAFQHHSPPLSPVLSGVKRAEKVIGQYLEEIQSDNEHWIRSELRQARFSVQQPRPGGSDEKPTDVFAKMKGIDLDDRRTKVKLPFGHAKFWSETRKQSKLQKKTYTVPCAIVKTQLEDIPTYSHYVSISSSFVAHNETTLQHWPYYGDEFDHNEAVALERTYWLDIQGRREKLHRLGMAEHFAPYAEDMLKDMDCQWSDVLHFLLDPSPDVGTNEDALEAATARESFCQEDFTREKEPWKSLLTGLPDPDPEKVGRAAILCERFQSLTRLPFWHIARRSDFTSELMNGPEEGLTIDKLTCRVCMRLDCPSHGEFIGEGKSTDDETTGPGVVDTDIVHPPNVNHRRRVGFPPSIDLQETGITGKDRQRLRYWQTGQNANLIHQANHRLPFYPCHHPGLSCRSAKCSCFERKIPCEKFCACPQSCPRKFRGCNCSALPKRKGKKRVCFEEESCACFQLGRECDADLCGDCNVHEVLDPVNKRDERVLENRCCNASLQRGIPKRTLLGDSAVHGIGLYAGESLNQHDFIGEYVGEVVAVEEGERRGAIHRYHHLSYLFTLNKGQDVDSTYFGNKLRFINHASEGKCNLYARVVMVNAVHRIALYAKRSIKAGEEVYYNYGEYFPIESGGETGQEKDQVQSKSTPQTRNATLLADFDDIDHDEDENGLRQAVIMIHNERRSRVEPSDSSDSQEATHGAEGTGSEHDSTGEDDADSYGDLSRYTINDGDTTLEGHDIGDDDFEPSQDLVSVVGEESNVDNGESSSDSDEEPLSAVLRTRQAVRAETIRKRLEELKH